MNLGRACTRTWTATAHCSTRAPWSQLASQCCATRSSTRLLSTEASRAVLTSNRTAASTFLLPMRTQSRRYIQKNAFESLGIYPPLALNLKSTMGIDTPSQLQSNFIPPILDGKDVLIRDTTGSGKTFGVLLSLLSKPRIRSTSSGSLGITSVLVVPNQELAFQLVSWTRSLFPSATQQQLDGMIQAIFTESSNSLDHTRDSTRSKRTTSKQDQKQLTPLSNDTQVEKLAKTLPHVLVATPVRLWNLIERGVLDLSGIETLVLDEVDHLIRLPKRFASQRQIYNRDLHPKPAELAVREIIRSAKAAGRYSVQEEASKSNRIQIVAASATMNRPIRHWLETNDWILDAEWVDTTKSVVLPEGIEHHCLVVGPDSIRNMKLEGDYKHTTEDAGEVDWADKDKIWKEQQLLPSEGTVTKFRDDDDRMLEGVATACMLDDIQTACVFFCSSPSLNDVATRLQGDFGLSVKLLEDAFHANQGSKQELARKKGVYLAHESNARGLDLPGLSHVFIVGLPSTPSSYLHMAGRTGRMGKKGSVLTIIRDDGNLEARARTLFNTLNVQIQPYSHVE